MNNMMVSQASQPGLEGIRDQYGPQALVFASQS